MNVRQAAFRLLALVGLAAASALAVDYWLPAPAFCSFRAGCDQVVASAYGRLGPVPLPLLGMVAFGCFFLITFTSRANGGLLGVGALGAGASGAGLIALQHFVLKQYCPFCLIADMAALLLAAVELGVPKPTEASALIASRSPATLFMWIATAILAIAGPPTWAVLKPPPEPPNEVRALFQPGQIVLVEITDFSCRYCRQAHPAVEQFLTQHKGTIERTRIVAPRPGNEDARRAARLYLYAEGRSRGETVAEALFATEDLSAANLERIAVAAGLPAEAVVAIQVQAELDRRLDFTTAWVERSGIPGLPQLWLNELLLAGSQTVDSLNAAKSRLERAVERE